MNSNSLSGIIHAYRSAISELSVLTNELSELSEPRSPHCSDLIPESPRLAPRWISHPALTPISIQRADDIPDLDPLFDDLASSITQINTPRKSGQDLETRVSVASRLRNRKSPRSVATTMTGTSGLFRFDTASTNPQWEYLIASAGLTYVDIKSAIFYCDIFSSFMVLCNLITLGWSLQHRFSTGRHLEIASALDSMLCAILLLEVLFRFCLERMYFIFGPTKFWNFLDIAVLVTMFIEIIVEATDDEHEHQTTNSKVLRTISFLRLFRIFRFVKVFRFLKYFRSGRLLVTSLMHGYTAFAWFCIFSISATYAFSLVIASRSIYQCEGEVDEPLCEYFGSVWISCSSVYQAMLGGIRWGALYDALLVLEPFYKAALFVLISFYYAVFLQVINGIFVSHVLRQDEVVKNEESALLQLKFEQELVNDLSEHFHRLDINGNGVLCKDELSEMFEDTQMSSMLSRCNLNTHSAEDLFELIDGDKSGQIDFFEFAMACKKFSGQASAVDVAHLRQEIRDLRLELRRGGKPSPARGKESSVMEASAGLTSPSRTFVAMDVLTSIQSQEIQALQRPVSHIQKTEMRAMLLEELEDVVACVRASCTGWTDMESGKRLTSDKVNLYHFNFYLMSPSTAASSITLRGLLKQTYPQNAILTQRHSSDSRIIGKGRVIKDVYGTDVRVRILTGMFFPHTNVYLDSGDECGIVGQVDNNGSSTSYKELIASSPARPDWFCSHWWGEPISDFVTCCQAHFRKRLKNKYWVCAYANRQHELSGDINDDPEETSFRKAMALATGTLLILDPAGTPFKRIWCDYELFTTISEQKTLDIVTLTDMPHLLTESPLPSEHTFEKMKREHNFPLKLLHKGMQVELENGNSTMDQDKINILNSMGKDVITGSVSEDLRRRNVDCANKALRGYFAVAAWPQAVRRGLAQDLLEGVEMSLAQIVCADERRTSLQLTLSGLKEMNDIEMKSIADCLPPLLLSFTLGLENCINISDTGVAAVAQKLRKLPLQHLELDFVSCHNLTDSSLTALASALPPSLVSIKLHFDHCRSITRAGVRVFAQGLPNSVKTLVATFRKTRCNETFASVRQLRKF